LFFARFKATANTELKIEKLKLKICGTPSADGFLKTILVEFEKSGDIIL